MPPKSSGQGYFQRTPFHKFGLPLCCVCCCKRLNFRQNRPGRSLRCRKLLHRPTGSSRPLRYHRKRGCPNLCRFAPIWSKSKIPRDPQCSLESPHSWRHNPGVGKEASGVSTAIDEHSVQHRNDVHRSTSTQKIQPNFRHCMGSSRRLKKRNQISRSHRQNTKQSFD